MPYPFFSFFRLFAAGLLATALLSGCASRPGLPPDAAVWEPTVARDVSRFSSGPAGGLPQGWTPRILTRTKKTTSYRLADLGGTTVLHAHAAAAASILMQDTDIDPMDRPWLSWRWRIERLLERSDNSSAATEDSPVRIMLAFDGDKGALPFNEQFLFETGRLLSGNEPPYAMLMYIWEKRAPVGTVISNTRTGRVKKIVAATGSVGLGQWRNLTRDIVADFKMAFGEAPGRLIGVGVMTDTDNTGETAEAWYGDIHLQTSAGLND